MYATAHYRPGRRGRSRCPQPVQTGSRGNPLEEQIELLCRAFYDWNDDSFTDDQVAGVITIFRDVFGTQGTLQGFAIGNSLSEILNVTDHVAIHVDSLPSNSARP